MSNLNVNNITPLIGTTGHIGISGSLIVSGTITANGNITLGDSTGDSVSFGAEISSSIIPNTTNTYNLGSTSKKWKDINASGNISASGTITGLSGSFQTLEVDDTLIVNSIIVTGSNTFTNWGNFKNRMPSDNRYFTVTTDPTFAGGWREGTSVPGNTTGSAPHLHFQLSGSGQAGVGLLNPQTTLHVSKSSDTFGAFKVDGRSHFNGFITSSGTISGSTFIYSNVLFAGETVYTDNILATVSANLASIMNVNTTNVTASGTISASGAATFGASVNMLDDASVANTLLTTDLSVLNGATLGNSATLDTHTITGKTFFNGNVTASGNISGSSTSTLQVGGTAAIGGTLSAGAGTFTTINTGQGANELYDMDQNVTTVSNPTFGAISASSLSTKDSIIASGSVTILGGLSVGHGVHGEYPGKGNITASGEISASGKVRASALWSNGVPALDFVKASNTYRLGGGGVNSTLFVYPPNVVMPTANLWVARSITSSMAISASGNIYAAEYFDNQVNINTIYSPIAGGSGIVTVGNITGGTISASAVQVNSLNSSGSIISAGTVTGLTGSFGRLHSSQISSSGTIVAEHLYSSDDAVITDTLTVGTVLTGNLTASGNVTASTSFANIVQAGNDYASIGSVNVYGATTASLYLSSSLSEVRFENLPITVPVTTGSLWLSGSAGQNSKYLVVFTGS